MKGAYRVLVRLYHPDMNQGHPVTRFLEVQEAYDVLKDPARRREHRQQLEWEQERRSRRYEPPPPPPPPRGRRRRPWNDAFNPFREARGADLGLSHLEIELDRRMAELGGHFSTRIPIATECPACGGRPLERSACDLCSGSGRLRMRVRATIIIPPGCKHLGTYDLQCYLELFGTRIARARVFVR